MSSVDETSIISKHRDTHLQAYDYHMTLITYDLGIMIEIKSIRAWILCMVDTHVALLKFTLIIGKKSLFNGIIFECLL